MGNFFINCDEATLTCDKTQYKEASFWERFRLSFHLLTCKHCKVYTKQNAVVTKTISYIGDLDTNKRLSKSEKTAIKNTIDKTL